MTGTRLPPAQRKAIILASAVKIANEHGLESVTFEAVADGCTFETTASTVRKYFTIKQLRIRTCADDNIEPSVRDEGRTMGIIAKPA